VRCLAILRLLFIVYAIGNHALAAPAFDPGPLSLLLNDGMTTEQVTRALGLRPNSVEQETCGTNTGEPWVCRSWIFTDGRRNLHILFRRENSNWVVNAWFVN
jgi:hypothetical protein